MTAGHGIDVSFDVPAAHRASLLATIHQTLIADAHLSPRSMLELERACDQGHVCVARADDEVVGWVLCLPRGRTTQELAGAFVVPARRGTSITTRLLQAALDRAPVTLCATSDPALARYLRWFWGFERWPLRRLLRYGGAGLLRDRMSWSRMRYGRAYLRLPPPTLLGRVRRAAVTRER